MSDYDARLEAENRALKDDIRHLEHAESAKFRRVDCLRIAQKYLEHLGRNDSNSLIGTAANCARFVETGDTGEIANKPAA